MVEAFKSMKHTGLSQGKDLPTAPKNILSSSQRSDKWIKQAPNFEACNLCLAGKIVLAVQGVLKVRTSRTSHATLGGYMTGPGFQEDLNLSFHHLLAGCSNPSWRLLFHNFCRV